MSDARRALLERELAEQSRWKQRPPFTAERLFTGLVHEEFLPAAEQAERRRAALARMLRHAAAEVPWWSRRLEGLGVDTATLASPGGLQRLPVLARQTLIDHFVELHARHLPAGEALSGTRTSTGTTGRPVKVSHSVRSIGHFAVQRQRQLRWFRFDPHALMANIQPARNLPRNDRGEVPSMGETVRRDGWFGIDHLFETGANIGLPHLTALPEQLRWLRDNAPAYLLSHSAHLEQIAVAAASAGARPPRLRGVVGIAQTMSSGMQATVEQVLGASMHLGYGLGEFGIVAGTCAEGGRYHVHAEHVLVEIVDEEGRPCRAGETGRVLVSGLSNAVMPLFRYDTGDRAEVVEGPCSCGRTLPSFGRVHGRYRRLASLPPGTSEHLDSLHRLFEAMPEALLQAVLRYQLYQRRDHGCELRLQTTGELDPAFERRVLEDWRAADLRSGVSLPLEFRVGAALVEGPGGRLDNFHSAFHPAPEQSALTTGSGEW